MQLPCLDGVRREIAPRFGPMTIYRDLPEGAWFSHKNTGLGRVFVKVRSNEFNFNPGWGSWDVDIGHMNWSSPDSTVYKLEEI